MNFPPKKPALGFLFLIIYFCQNLDSIQLLIETERNVFISKDVKYLDLCGMCTKCMEFPGSNTAYVYVTTYLAMSLDLYIYIV